MPDGQTRNGRWSSRSFFGLRASHRKIVPEKPSQRFGDAAVDSREPDDLARKGLSTSQMDSTSSSTAEKLLRHGSRLLSIIRLHGSTGERGSTGKSYLANMSQKQELANASKTLKLHPSGYRLSRLWSRSKKQLLQAVLPSRQARLLLCLVTHPTRFIVYPAKHTRTRTYWRLAGPIHLLQ